MFLLFERHGQRFAFWSDEAQSLLHGALQPVYRLPRQSAITEEVPVHSFSPGPLCKGKETSGLHCTPMAFVRNIINRQTSFNSAAHLLYLYLKCMYVFNVTDIKCYIIQQLPHSTLKNQIPTKKKVLFPEV